MKALWILVAMYSVAVWAHEEDVVRVTLRFDANPGQYFESVVVSAETLPLLMPIDADGDGVLSQTDLDAKAAALRVGFWDEAPLTGEAPCIWRQGQARMHGVWVTLDAEFQCPSAPHRQDFRFLRVLPQDYQVVLISQRDGFEFEHGVATRQLSSISIEPKKASPKPFSPFALAALALLGSMAAVIVGVKRRAQ